MERWITDLIALAVGFWLAVMGVLAIIVVIRESNPLRRWLFPTGEWER